MKGFLWLNLIERRGTDEMKGISSPLDAYPFLIFVRFLIDAALTGASAWMIVRAGSQIGRGLLEIVLASMWTAVALVAGAGVILAESGGLSGDGFLAVHFGVFLGCMIWRRTSLGDDWLALRGWLGEIRRLLNWRTPEGVLTIVFFLILAALTGLAAVAEPVVYDAQAYHLPRIAQWLQDGRIQMLTVQDERLNFVTGLPDLVMAWFLTATSDGFHLVNLTQSIGGLMAFIATVGLARETGLQRIPSLLAAALLFGMANVVVQFTATQTDLFTTGVLAAAFYVWICAQQKRRCSVLGGLGAGLALAAKGTLFYLAPGLIIWVIWLAVAHPLPWREWQRTLLAALGGILFFAGPGFFRNWRAYGSVLGPHEWVGKLHHGASSAAELGQKLQWNLQATLAQNFEPNSQPWIFRKVSRIAGMSLAQSLPEQDKFSLDNQNRKNILRKNVLPRNEPDADATSFGVVGLFFFFLGSIIALCRWKRADSRLVLVWSGGLVASLLFFELMQQWHPFAFRYFVLAGPWIAVVAAWGIEQLGRSRRVVWILVLLATMDVGWTVTTDTHQAGWRAVAQPERSLGYYISQSWRGWSEQLDSTKGSFFIALPEERPLAGFYRQTPKRVVRLLREAANAGETAEEFIAGRVGWTIVPATRFLGAEGNVRGAVWLNHGNESDPYSIAAYRPLFPGEKAGPVVYRHRHSRENDRLTEELLVKTWNSDPAYFSLTNLSAAECHYRITTPTSSNSGTLSANANILVHTELPASKVSEIICTFDADANFTSSENLPAVELVTDAGSH